MVAMSIYIFINLIRPTHFLHNGPSKHDKLLVCGLKNMYVELNDGGVQQKLVNTIISFVNVFHPQTTYQTYISEYHTGKSIHT